VYQNLEGKQVNAYFWVLVGLLGFLARRPPQQHWPHWLHRPGRDGW
jgi:hypothetical protein